MAARSQQNASDNFVEQLLRSGPEVSGYDGTEAEAEEVDYDETDEDLQDVQGPSQSDRGRDTNRWATLVPPGGPSRSVLASSPAADLRAPSSLLPVALLTQNSTAGPSAVHRARSSASQMT